LGERRVAFITGASRGIGKATALALAEKGYDIVVTARTVKEGEAYEHSATLTASDTSPLPGSLETTAAEIEKLGRDALPLRLDILDRESLDAAVAETLARWGRIDALINNAVYTGPGSMDLMADLPLDVMERIFQANVFNQIYLTERVLPHMLERGDGTIVNLTSAVAEIDPPAPAGQGGWGLGYAASKGAFHRVAGFLHVEYGRRGIRAFNVEPGFVVTERMEIDQKDMGFDFPGAPPRVPAAAIAFLVTSPEAECFRGHTVRAQMLVKDNGLLPGWPA
jgi:NAD(P)-dependent dehydrogenase (short-subunit alcohol dehydrogenase family)